MQHDETFILTFCLRLKHQQRVMTLNEDFRRTITMDDCGRCCSPVRIVKIENKIIKNNMEYIMKSLRDKYANIDLFRKSINCSIIN